MGARRVEAVGKGASPPTHASPRHGGLILLVLCSAQVILAVDVTVVNVASASIEHALGFSTANLQWVITAYSLTFGGFLLLGGRLSDLFGRRRLFVVGICGFATASFCAGFAGNTVELIAARLVQGVFAAVTSPAVLSLLAASFPEGRPRQHAYAMWATAGSIGGLTGFFFGGVVISVLGWRWIFFINVPIAAMTLVGALVLVHPPSQQVHARRLDVPGAVLVTLALGLVVYGLGEAESTSWTSVSTMAAFCCAPVLLALFVVVERRAAEPLLPFSLLFRRAAVGNVLSVLQQLLGASTSFLAPLFMQQIWGFRPDQAGAGTLPLSLGFFFGARVSSLLARRFGVRVTVAFGFSLATLGMTWLTFTPLHPSYATSFLPGLFIRGFGQAIVVVQALGVATSGVRPEDQGVAAGLYNMSQQLGAALGLAAIATVASAATAAAGGHVLGEAHGLRVALGVCACVAFSGVLIAVSFLRRSGVSAVAGGPSTPAVGQRPGVAPEAAPAAAAR